ncbi:MAG TPA: molybdopterin-dependent oxidoreductase, partial [bacterium]|nr:molybdopterin-dependent oxidoreductase [bacterium]
VVGSNPLMTRTPDVHFLIEARHKGSKVTVFSPDFSMTSKVADEWVPLHQGQDGAFWMAVTHVILKEFYVDKTVPGFLDYVKRTSDAPILVELEKGKDGRYRAGQQLRASKLKEYKDEENAEWKMAVLDAVTGKPKVLKGSVGHRWQKKKGDWNLKLEDSLSNEAVDPALYIEGKDVEQIPLAVSDFSEGTGDLFRTRNVPAKRLKTPGGEVLVTTGLELLLAQYGVKRGERQGEWPKDYEDADAPFTPAWQEKFTGVNSSVVIQFARQWADTAEKTGGKCSVIIGAGANHWYHNNLIYRSCIVPLILCGCVGKNGGGLNHYVGQEKLAPQASWGPVAFATDWGGPPRLQNAPSYHYVHTGQWRYDKAFGEMCPVADKENPMASGHTIDKQILATRAGWMPCFPQFNKSNLEVVKEAEKAGAKTDEEIVQHVVKELKSRKLKFSMEDPDNPESYPRVWYIWRGNALMASAKGHEYFLKTYLGTHNNLVAEECAKDEVKEVVWHDKTDLGKIDLVVDLNFRMDTSALYSDIVLPAATYYEKNDLNSTDMHTFIHPLQAAVRPCWEAKGDWEIFRGLAEHTSKLAEKFIPNPVKDILATPLMHDTPAEIARTGMEDWAKGEIDLIPGKTAPNLKVVTRDYVNLYKKYISLGKNFRDNGLGLHGTIYPVSDLYDKYLETHPVETWGGQTYPSLRQDLSACEVILHFAAETNGELAYRAYDAESHKTGIDHTHLAADTRSVLYSFKDLVSQPRRYLTTPFWTGTINKGRTYSAFCQNVEENIPWRTTTGRQQLYLDHPAYRAFGEHLPTYKPRAELFQTRDLLKTGQGGGALTLNFLTPHGKWHIHSTFGDNLRMSTLSRGVEPLWINDVDAGVVGITDNDWVEILNDNGVVVTRACVSARIPRGICMIYHATERTLSVPKSPGRGNRRAGGHNSLTRTRLKPVFMVGGYGQFTYAFNYWGPQGINRDTFVSVKKLSKLNW